MDLRLLITDVETTGFDSKSENTVEIGAVLYSVTSKTALQQWVSLFYSPTNAAAHINNISKAMLDEMKVVETTYDTFWRMAFSAHAIVAHNADFDKAFIKKFVSGISVDGRPFPDLPWLCTYKSGIRWTGMVRQSPNNKLPSLAAAHDIVLGGEHRALFDCNLIAQMFMKTPDLEEQIRRILKIEDPEYDLSQIPF